MIYPTVIITKSVCRQDGGIAPHPHHQLEFPHYTTHFSLGEGLCVLIWFYIRTIPLAFRRGASLLLPLHRMLSPSQPLQKDNYPSPRTKLASLVKGEVLSPEKIRATTEGIALHHQPFQNRTIPCFAPSPLPPLEKGEVARLI